MPSMRAAGDAGGDRLGVFGPGDGDAPDGWAPDPGAFSARTGAVLEAIRKNAPASQQLPVSDTGSLAMERGIIEPPLPFDSLVLIKEASSDIPQTLDVMAQNVEGYGHRLVPLMEFDAPDAAERAAVILMRERAHWRERLNGLVAPGERERPPFGVPWDGSDREPSVEEVAQALDAMRRESADERERFECFFSYCSADRSFVALRSDCRQDLELLGNSALEVLRDGDGRLAGLEYVPFVSVRLTVEDREQTEYVERVLVGPHRVMHITRRRRFRRFIQFDGMGGAVWFKELRDPRRISRSTGEVVGPDHPADDLANELIHRKLFSHGRSPYGMIRWVGVLMDVLGLRQAGEVNFLHFDNKGMPIGILAVEGGVAAKGTQERVTSFMANHCKGRRNYHRLLVMEASMEEGELPPGAPPRLRFIDLSKALQTDALFQRYIERGSATVRSAWRLPKFFFGESKDFNRSTADVIRMLAEEQVFAPERLRVDEVVNRQILPELGARWHRFESLGLPMKDPRALSEMVSDLMRSGAVTPADVRSKVGEALGLPLAPLPGLLGQLTPAALAALLAALVPEAVLEHVGIELEPKESKAEGPIGEAGSPGRLVPSQELPPGLRGGTAFSAPLDEEDEELGRILRMVEAARDEMRAAR